MELNDALNKIKNDQSLKDKFYSDPQGELKALGVDTSKLKIKKVSNPSKTVKPGFATSICVSVGELVGASVGS
jgi:hypothetical protein